MDMTQVITRVLSFVTFHNQHIVVLKPVWLHNEHLLNVWMGFVRGFQNYPPKIISKGILRQCGHETLWKVDIALIQSRPLY